MEVNHKELNRGLAKNLLIATLSYQLGVIMQYYEKNYFNPEEEIGEYWYVLASYVQDGMRKASGSFLNNLDE